MTANAASRPRHPNQVPIDWDSDRVDRIHEAQIEEAYFDEALSAWILSRYADVEAAFRSSALIPAGPRDEVQPGKEKEAEYSRMRSEARNALLHPVIEQLRVNIEHAADTILAGLPAPGTIELVGDYAAPLCEHAAVAVTGIAPSTAATLMETAEQISAAAAEPLDRELGMRAKVGTAKLQPHFPAGPVALRESGFVALSFTLRRMLSNAWFVLIRHPDEWARLHDDPALVPGAVDELMRFGGLPRMLFRMATRDLTLNGVPIRKGERLILRLVAANRDPQQFKNPGMCSVSGHSKKHLSLGAGSHSCVGAPLLRLIMTVATQKMIERYKSAKLHRSVEWAGGSGFLFPLALHVRMTQKSSA